MSIFTNNGITTLIFPIKKVQFQHRLKKYKNSLHKNFNNMYIMIDLNIEAFFPKRSFISNP
jgi:hypothetical protein